MKKKLSRAKRKLQKQKLLRQQQRLAKQPTLTQAEVDAFFQEHLEKIKEQQAKKKQEAQDKAFDHFINNGEVVAPEYYYEFERFFGKEKIASRLPDIDIEGNYE